MSFILSLFMLAPVPNQMYVLKAGDPMQTRLTKAEFEKYQTVPSFSLSNGNFPAVENLWLRQVGR